MTTFHLSRLSSSGSTARSLRSAAALTSLSSWPGDGGGRREGGRGSSQPSVRRWPSPPNPLPCPSAQRTHLLHAADASRGHGLLSVLGLVYGGGGRSGGWSTVVGGQKGGVTFQQRRRPSEPTLRPHPPSTQTAQDDAPRHVAGSSRRAEAADAPAHACGLHPPGPRHRCAALHPSSRRAPSPPSWTTDASPARPARAHPGSGRLTCGPTFCPSPQVAPSGSSSMLPSPCSAGATRSRSSRRGTTRPGASRRRKTVRLTTRPSSRLPVSPLPQPCQQLTR